MRIFHRGADRRKVIMQHTPVLVKEVLQYLDPKPGENFIDCTLGLGGHAKFILEKTAPGGMLLAIEQDRQGLNEAKSNLAKFKNQTVFVNNNFVNLDQIARAYNFSRISGILFDLGLALWQIKEKKYGYSFEIDSPLDMRMFGAKMSASEILNRYHQKKLADMLYYNADLGNSRAIARKLIEFRNKKEFSRTSDLIEAIGTKNPKILAPIWQALRIEVNNELENLQIALRDSINLLKPGGRLAVISFHSGEDRIVKNFFKENKNFFKILTKKPITPDPLEIKNNRRARSAKLRAAEKIC